VTRLLSVQEVHEIAYLTMRGWSLVGDDWTKAGFEYSYKVSRGCGCCEDTRTTPYFPLAEAYAAQNERDDAVGREPAEPAEPAEGSHQAMNWEDVLELRKLLGQTEPLGMIARTLRAKDIDHTDDLVPGDGELSWRHGRVYIPGDLADLIGAMHRILPGLLDFVGGSQEDRLAGTIAYLPKDARLRIMAHFCRVCGENIMPEVGGYCAAHAPATSIRR
jgi:hypothetical protein